MTNQYRVWTYAVWGNEEDGFWVNDRFDSGKSVAVSGIGNEKVAVVKALKSAGFVGRYCHYSDFWIDSNGEDEPIYVNFRGKPVVELQYEQEVEDKPVYRIYLREGPNNLGETWGREFGTDYPTLEKAQEVKAEFQKSFPRSRYFIRKASARYPQISS